jgi:hypothetical protein
VPRLLQDRQRHPARGTQVPPPLLRNPGEVLRLRQRVHAPELEQVLEVAEHDRGVDFRIASRRTDAGKHDLQLLAELRPEVARLRHRGNRHRGEVRHQLRVPGPDRLHHDRIGGADDGPPPRVFPEAEILRRHQLVAHHAARHDAEARRIAGVDHLLGRGGVEVRRRLRAQDQHPRATGRHRDGAPQLAARVDGPMRAGRHAQSAAHAGLVHNAHRLVVHGDRPGRADANARQAGDAGLRVDRIHSGRRTPVIRGSGSGPI